MVKLAQVCLAGNTYRSDRLAAASIYGGRFLTSVNECPAAVGRVNGAVGTSQVGVFMLTD